MVDKPVLAVLIVRDPDGSVRSIQITKTEYTIGRSPDNDLQLPDSKVSSEHAVISFRDDHIFLTDRDSSNGIFIGAEKLPPGKPTAITFKKTFRIGPYLLGMELPAKSTGPQLKIGGVEEEAPGLSEEGEQAAESHPARPASEPPPEPKPPSESVRQLRGIEAEPPQAPPVQPFVPSAGPPASEEAFGVSKDGSRYLDYLPPIYGENEFLGQFLLAFEGLLTPIGQTVDNFDFYIDPALCPPFFLEQLAAWLGMTLDEKWPLEKRRAVVAEAADLYRRRGSRAGLSRYLEIYVEVTPEIVETDDRPHHFEVTLRLPKGKHVDRATVERIIEANKPAHTTYTLEMVAKS